MIAEKTQYKTLEGIVLKAFDSGDYDKVIVLWSLQEGIVKFIAKSIKKPNAKLLSVFLPYNFVEVSLAQKNNKFPFASSGYLLQSGSNIDPAALLYIQGLSECILNAFYEGGNDLNLLYENYRQTILNLQNIISESQRMLEFIKFFYMFLSALGYQPLVKRCGKEHILNSEEKAFYFEFTSSSIFCLEHRPNVKPNQLFLLDNLSLRLIRNISENKEINLKGELPPKILIQVAGFFFSYYEWHIGIRLPIFDFFLNNLKKRR